jgi:DNA-binding PadR family transcriptional regulator
MTVRVRWLTSPGRWVVRGRVERFAEACALLALTEGPAHGYELRARVGELDEDVDLPRLYRTLRTLELEGFVRSNWQVTPGSPPRRTYSITPAGRRLLDQWAAALRSTQNLLAEFLHRHDASPRTPGDPRANEGDQT